MSTQLTDADLARLDKAGIFAAGVNHALQVLEYSPEFIDCVGEVLSAIPALVAEVRRLRDRVEALEWFVECHDVAMWLNCTNRFTASWEVTFSMIAAREAIR